MSKVQRDSLKKRLDKFIAENSTEMEREAAKLPNINAYARHPVTSTLAPLWVIVTNLNDHHKWSRDQIADWLDDLNDEGVVDLSFKEKESI